jgi:hypothetical protein
MEKEWTALEFNVAEAKCEWLKTDREIGIAGNATGLYEVEFKIFRTGVAI